MIMNIEDIIKVPYTTQPHMSRNTGDAFNRTPSAQVLTQKEILLGMFGSDLYGMTIASVTNQLVRRACSITGKPVTGNIVDFAMNFEEDVAIMHKGKLAALCFCFPSSWIPHERLGMSLTEIHGPVADGDHLQRVSQRLAETMADPTLGGFKRHVWTINKVSELCNHPIVKEKYEQDELTLDNLYFRVETQTTLPMADCASSLFFVNVKVYPLRDIWNVNSHRIIESLYSMSDAVLTYKNLHEIKSYLSQLD
jgi:hypothetical protein